MGLVRSIPVADANGDELTVYQFEDRRFLSKVRRLKLCTGEAVQIDPDGTLVVVRTGERLSRLDASSGLRCEFGP